MSTWYFIQRVLTIGTFIKFNCANGKENSNTHMLECLGWYDFGVEASRAHAYSGAVCRPGDSATDVVDRGFKSVLHGVCLGLEAFPARHRQHASVIT